MTSWTVLDSVVLTHRLHIGFQPEHERAFEDLRVTDLTPTGDYIFAMTEVGRVRLFDSRGQLLDEASPDSALGVQLGFEWSPGFDVLPLGEVAPFSVSTRRAAAEALAESLRVTIGEEGNIIRVRLSSSDRRRAASIVNAVMSRTVSLAATLKLEQIDDRAEVLEAQLARADTLLRDAERRHQRFQVNAAARGGPGVEGDPAAERLIQIRVDADQLRMDRERLETLLAEIPTSGVRIEAMEVIPAVRSSSELSRALTELARARADIRRLDLTGDASQLQLIRSLAESLENVAIPRLGQAVVNQLMDQEDLARRQSADAAALLTDIPPQRIEEARLSRQVAVAGTLFQDTYRAYEETTLAQAVARPDIRVLDVAVAPLTPQKPTSTPVALVLLSALVAAVGVPLLLDSLNPSLREGSDIVEGLGAQLLGVLPRIGAGRGGDPGHERTVNAFHELRRNVTFALNGGGPITFAVSSPGPGEGKSVTAANLAFAFAESGREVMLLDADVRSGRLHEAVGADSEPGLTDLLMADCSLTDTIQATPMDGVELIAAGTFAEDGPELLGSPDLESHLRELGSRYDVVIVDCPALDVGGDAVLLSIAAGAVVMVFRHGQTHSERARATMDWISRFPFRVAGAVFNDVPLREARRMRPSAAPVLNLPNHHRS